MKKEDLKKVKDFHEKVTMQQIIDPIGIREVYHLVAGKDAPQVPYMKMQRAITVFINQYAQDVLDNLEELFEETDDQLEEENDPRSPNYKHDSTETSAPEVDPPKEEQSHSEEGTKVFESVELAELEAAYENAEEANEKRSLKMKINALRKKL